ncbi:hypothetical protein [Bacteroides cellulosilyticus]|uniref:hypothetical protein n=1 Tax=Bacteroides cellulosilyticus TaxID=246787 RepID=UPI00101E1102|nr:hypothetical protein [Bacteroides cellulosilyticus]
MKRLFLITFILSVFSVLPSLVYSQVIVKDFDEVTKRAKVQVQHVTTVESTAKVPYVADIKKLKKTTDLPPEERQALEENSIPDTLYIRQLKQQDQLLFQKSSVLKSGKSVNSDFVNFDLLHLKRWFPFEDNEE